MSDYRRSPGEGDSLSAQLRAERSRAARLAAELVIEREKVRQLQEAFNHKDNESWHQHETIETLKVELRGIANLAAQLQSNMLAAQAAAPALPPRAEEPPTGRPTPFPDLPAEATPAAQEAQMALQGALLDLEERLQQAVALVLDELNTRKAAEARIRELEQQLATVRRRIGNTP
jgi:hypothetical protein